MTEIILAADKLTVEQCEALGGSLGPRLYAIKVHVLVDKEGPGVIERLKRAGWTQVWVDAKLHDIPATVELRSKQLASAGADIISVHAKGEVEMMEAALTCGKTIFGITELTSVDEAQVELSSGKSVLASVLYHARMAALVGLHGIVCSPQEVGYLSKRPELKTLNLVTPGIRLLGSDAHDQKRFDTPDAAAINGADYEVIGRELTQAQDPVAAYERIAGLIAQAKTGSIVDKRL